MALEDQDILDQVVAAREASVQGRLTKDEWARKAWSWYNNESDDVEKEDWQTKLRIPKWAMAVDQATSQFKASLRNSARFFGIEVLSDDPAAKALAGFFGVVIHELMRRKDVGFVPNMADGLKVGFITNMIVQKIGWQKFDNVELRPTMLNERIEVLEQGKVIGYQDRQSYGTEEVLQTYSLPRMSLVDPLYFYPDPKGLGLYNIHEVKKDLWQVLEMGRGVFNREKLALLEKEEPSQKLQEADEKARNQQTDSGDDSWRKTTKIMEYWGPLFHKGTGKLYKRNQVVTVANDKHILRVDTFPYWDGKDPFVVTNLLRVPFNVWGKLLIQHSDSLQLYVNELFNMIFDSLKMSVLKPLAVDVSLLDDVEDILTGLFPGKTFKMKGPNGVQQIEMRGPGVEAFNAIGLLGQELQNSHGVTEFLAGLPTTRGRPTATEISSKTQQSAGFFDGLMSDYEEMGVEPVIEKFYNRVMQFMDDWSDPAIVEIAKRFGVAELLVGMDPIRRHALMKQPFRFRAVGLNAALKRTETMEKVLKLLEIVGQIPGAAQTLPLQKIMDKVIEGLDMQDLVQQVGTTPNVIAPQGQGLDAVQPIDPQLVAQIQEMMRGGQGSSAKPNRPSA
jgi:hypothetical protein